MEGFFFVYMIETGSGDGCFFFLLREVEANLENRVCNDYFDIIFRIRPY